MFINNEIKKQLEKLSNEEDNKKCFDCENQPARWTSLNNGIYLCHECSEEHKNIEPGLSIIKSINLEQWTKNQLNIMKVGGNKKLKTFLGENNIPQNIDKKTLYNSKVMVYYRKQLKAQAEGELLLEQLPPKEEFLNSYNENYNMSNTNINQIDNNFKTNENLVFYDNDTNNQFIDGHLIDYPKSSIAINEEDYTIAKEKKILENKLENSVLKKESLLNVEKDPKFSSISNENEIENDSLFENSGYIGTISNIVSTVWETGSNTASNIKEKINEYQIGKGLLYLGGKVYDGVIFIGGKIIEKGSDIIHSQAAQNIVHKASEGISYITQRITGANDSITNNENNNNNYIDKIEENKNKYFNTSDYDNDYDALKDPKENLLV